MIVKLFTDSDTCLVFKSRAQAFIYVDKHNLKQWMLLSVNTKEEMKDILDNSSDDTTVHEASVFNPFIGDGETGSVEWFKTEHEALIYIGSFI